MRRSTRVHKMPIWQKDFVVSTSCSTNHPISDVLTYDHLQPHYKYFVSTVLNHHEPNPFLEAQRDTNWIAAMKEEVATLEHNKT